MGDIVMAFIVMADYHRDRTMAYIVIAYMAMARYHRTTYGLCSHGMYIIMIIMAHVVLAYIVMARYHHGSRRRASASITSTGACAAALVLLRARARTRQELDSSLRCFVIEHQRLGTTTIWP